MAQMIPGCLADAYAALDHAHHMEIAAETASVLAIAAIIDHYRIDETSIAEGTERLITPGGDGTPTIGEFAALEIAGILGCSPDAALDRLSSVLAVRHRFPRLWEAVLAGKARFWQATHVTARCHHLTAQAASWVDRHLSHALTLGTWARARRSLEGWIIAADREAAHERSLTAKETRGISVGPIQDGHADIHGRLNAADAIAFDHALTQIATTLPADQPLAHRRAAAVGELARATFGQDTIPAHTLIIHINAHDPALPTNTRAEDTTGYGPRTGAGHMHGPVTGADSQASGVARIERWGALLTTALPEFLTGSKVIVRPILHHADVPSVDAYETPTQLRHWVEQRNPVDVFPYGTRPARSCDLDHTRPYRPGLPEQTRADNLGPLSRLTHRAKTHGNWHLTQPQPGVFHWRSPAGYHYQVTTAGTIRLTTPTPPRSDWVEPPDDLHPPPETGPDLPPSPETLAWEHLHHTLHGHAA